MFLPINGFSRSSPFVSWCSFTEQPIMWPEALPEYPKVSELFLGGLHEAAEDSLASYFH